MIKRNLQARSISVLVIAAVVMSAAGCSKGQGGKSEAALADAKSARAEGERLLRTLPESDQDAINLSQQRLAESLEAGFASATANRNVAGFIDERLSSIDRLKADVKVAQRNIEESKKSGDTRRIESDLEYNNKNMAGHFLSIAAIQSFVDKAVALDPIFADALAQREATPVVDGVQRATISSIVAKLALMPCRSVNGKAPNAGVFSLRGVGLGMTREQAIAGVCESENGAVWHVADPNGPFDAQAYSRRSDIPANPADWEAFRAGKAESARTSEDVEAWASVAKPRLRPLDFCFACENREARIEDGLTAWFLPSGHVVDVKRTQNFVGLVQDGGGTAVKSMPKPLKDVLGPLKAKFGEPSFIYHSAAETQVAWVFRDRSKPLPIENWYYSKVGYDDVLQYKAKGFLSSVGGSRKSALKKDPPVATYCVSKAGLLPSYIFERELFSYAVPREDVSAGVDDGMIGIRMPDQKYPTGYLPRWEAAGYTASCGVVVWAQLGHVLKGSIQSTPRNRVSNDTNQPDPEAPVLFADVFIRDLDARDQLISEEAKAAALYRANKIAADKGAQEAFVKDPRNSFRP